MAPKSEITRFFVAGTTAGVIDLGIYYFLVHFVSFSVSKGISFTCAGIAAFVLNRFWVFPLCKKSSYLQMRRYMLINCLALEANIIINQVILNILPQKMIMAWVIAAMLAGVVTFIGFKWWVFTKE